MLFYLHERLREHPDTLFKQARVVLDAGLAQQLLKSYPQLIGHDSVVGVAVRVEVPVAVSSRAGAGGFFTGAPLSGRSLREIVHIALASHLI